MYAHTILFSPYFTAIFMKERLKLIEKYIRDSFDFSNIKINEKKLKYNGIKSYILDILGNSKLRIGPKDSEVMKMIEAKVVSSIENSLPITLVPAIGGFKGYQAESFPHIDFAELMQLQFLLESTIEISKVYKPGLIIEYTADALAMCIVDNYKTESVETYVKEFKEMLEKVQKVIPENVFLKQTSFSDFYKLEDMKEQIEREYKKAKESGEFKQIISERIRHAKNDFVFDGWEDLTALSEKEKEELLADSVIKHKVWLNIDYANRREYLEGKERIPVLHRPFPGCLPIKSVKGSDLQFWVCNGVFEIAEENNISFKLVTPNQYDGSKYKEVILEQDIFGCRYQYISI